MRPGTTIVLAGLMLLIIVAATVQLLFITF